MKNKYQQMSLAYHKQAGFTLIEVMVVVVILGILAAFVVPNILDRPDQARATKASQDIRSLEGALQLYRLDNFRYPTETQGLEALVKKPTSQPVPQNFRKGGYIDRMPKDPWGGEYQYKNPGERNPNGVDIFSGGINGLDNEEDNIGNW